MADAHVIVLPGGGYAEHAPHEAEPVVSWLAGIGIEASVFRYPLNVRHPVPLLAVRAEIRRLRAAGAERIGLMGFSAGGHLAGLAALAPDAAPEESVQFAVLGYSITSMETETYRPSRLILLGPDASPELRRATSLDALVTPGAPPFFLWHTAEDPYVPVEHTYRLARMLADNEVPHATHVFAHGPHSLGLAQGAGDAALWTTLAEHWMHENHAQSRTRDAMADAEPAVTAAPRVDPALARDVAAAYLDAPSRPDPLTTAAYARLVAETDRLFGLITSAALPDPVRVVFTTCPAPYGDAWELIASVTGDRLLEVDTVAADPDRHHPLMGSGLGGEYDRFRAVHDILGHAGLGLGFDRDGEFAVWLAQERMHSPLAGRALATELHGQHSVRWTTGQVASPKATLLDAGQLRQARLGAGSAVPGHRRGDRRAP